MNLLPSTLRKHPVASIAVICIVGLGLIALRNLYTPDKDPRLAAIRQAGYPVTLADLDDFYSHVPDDRNAALLYLSAFQSDLLTNSFFDEFSPKPDLTRGEPLPEELRDGLLAALATNAPDWELLYAPTNFLASRFPLDFRLGYQVLLPHLAKVKHATSLLSLEALAHASAHETNQAFASLNAAAHAGDSLRNEPILISYLVRIACANLVAKRLEQTLNLVALDDGQLRSLQMRFAAADDPRGAARALAGERAFGLSFFINRDIQRSITGSRQSQQAGLFPSGLPGQLAFAGYRASGLMTKDRNFFLDSMANYVALAELPTEERIKSGAPPLILTTNRFLIISRMLLPALSRVLDRADEHSARMRVAQTALAIERFRLTSSGALPENLEQLSPQFIAAVPVDPFDGKPLRYKKLANGFVVYSIGLDLKDDGGAEPPPSSKTGSSTKSTPRDLTFAVERK